MTCVRQIGVISWPTSTLLRSTSTGAPSARARSDGFQDSTKGTAASAAPTTAVAPVAKVRNFLRLSSTSLMGAALGSVWTAIAPTSLISLTQMGTIVWRADLWCARERPYVKHQEVSHYTQPFDETCRRRYEFEPYRTGCIVLQRQRHRRSGAGIRDRVPATTAAAAAGGTGAGDGPGGGRNHQQ